MVPAMRQNAACKGVFAEVKRAAQAVTAWCWWFTYRPHVVTIGVRG
jgi:hypothetical protein